MNTKYNYKILNILKNNRIVIYGAGFVAEMFYKALIQNGLDRNIECFVVSQKEKNLRSINEVEVKSIYELRNDNDIIICLAVNEVLKNEIEKILENKKITNYIWISPYLAELFLGEPIKTDVKISVDRIVQHNCDYRLAIRYLAIENYFQKNDNGYDIYLKAQGLHCGKRTAEKRLRSFCNLILECENYGYSTEHKILVDNHNEILDGAHRIALVRYYQIEEVMCDVFENSVDFFKLCGDAVLLTKSKIMEAEFTNDELKVIEDAYWRIRETGRVTGK